MKTTKTMMILGLEFDLDTDVAEFVRQKLDIKSMERSNYAVVKLDGPVDADSRADLADVGFTIHERVGEDTYVGRYDPRDKLEPLEALESVYGALRYPRLLKLRHAMLYDCPDLEKDSPEQIQSWNLDRLREAETDQVDLKEARDQRYLVIPHDDVTPEKLAWVLIKRDGFPLDNIDLQFGHVRAKLNRNDLRRLLGIDEVKTIELPERHTTCNNVALRLMGHPPGLALRTGVPLDGAGQRIAIADVALGNGKKADAPAAIRDRIVALMDENGDVDNEIAVLPDVTGHGTHVAGSIVGNETIVDEGKITGTAPGATLLVQLISDDGENPTVSNIADLLDEAAKRQVRVHSNSWGNNIPEHLGSYTSLAAELDRYTTSGETSSSINFEQMLVCCAAGNDGPASSTVNSPATAKNCVAVGATQSNRPAEDMTWGTSPFKDRVPVQFADDRVADNPGNIAPFSGRGPTLDGRIKPDVVASGTSILSVAPDPATMPDGWAIPAEQRWFHSVQPPAGYTYMSGTSMATPLVAGCAAVIRQSLRVERGLRSPSSALVKALLVNGAQPHRQDGLPDLDNGFGQVNLSQSIAAVRDAPILVDETSELTDSVRAWSRTIEVPAGGNGLKVTLVWRDPRASTGFDERFEVKLQNFLGLKVERTCGVKRFGNGALDFDCVNNVQQVAWPVPGPETATIRVEVTKGLTTGRQRFALVARTI